MSFQAFTANAGVLWFPATDDIACVLHSGGSQLMVLVLDHEELIALSRVHPA